jgi:hypothetical protein
VALRQRPRIENPVITDGANAVICPEIIHLPDKKRYCSIGGAFSRKREVGRGALRAFDRTVWRKPMAFAADAEIPGAMGFLSTPNELMTLGKT